METQGYVVGAILLLCLCSILTRCSYMLFGDRFPLSESVRRTLRYAPVAALVAIIVPELLPLSADPRELLDARPLAAVIAVILFLRTRNTLAVIVGGMVALWTLSFMLSVGF